MNFILCLFIAFNLNAQEGTGFQEIDPKKDAVILKRIEAEKLLKKMAEKKKAEAAARQAEEKRKAQLLKDYEENVKQEKLARLERQKKEKEEKEAQNKLREQQQKKDEEQKRLAAEQIKRDKQQKDYESRINKELAERNKKEIKVKREFTWLETVMLKQKILEEAKKSMKRDFGTPEEARIRDEKAKQEMIQNRLKRDEERSVSLQAAEKREQENAQDLREAEERRRIAFSSNHKENKRASNCIFPGNPIFPQGMKVVAVGGYEGTYPGGRGFRHHPMTEVTINVVGSGPVALLILVYEPVRWKIKSVGADIAAVAVIGYHRQEIVGVGAIPKLISSYEGSNYICPYREYSSEHADPFNVRADRRLREYSTELFGKEPENSIEDYTLPPEVTVKAD